MKPTRCRCRPATPSPRPAALPETFFTVWHNVFERGALKKGETLLVHGGSSGIGTTAIQLASAFGAYVVTTAGSEEKCAACLKLGADRAINYQSEDFVALTKDATGGRGADVILDMVGGDYVARNYEAAAIEGRIVQIATQGGSKRQPGFLQADGQAPRSHRLDAAAAHGRVQGRDRRRARSQGLAAARRPPHPAGHGHDLPAREAWRAHERMQEGEHIGKIVLDVGE